MPLGDQGFGLDCDFSCDSFLTNHGIGGNKKMHPTECNIVTKAKVERKLPFFLPICHSKICLPESLLELLVSWLYTYTLVFECIYWCSQRSFEDSGSPVL